MDTNDERLMEHTEKIVADMLKYVLAPNEMRGDDGLEFVIIDETGVTSENAAKSMEAADEQSYVFNTSAMKMSAPATDNAFNEVLNDIELFLAQGLGKIRAEYPMYAESTNSYICNNCLSKVMQPTGGYGLFANASSPMNNNLQFAGNAAVSDFGNRFGSGYPNNLSRTQTCIGELWNDEDELPIVRNNKHLANESTVDLENEANEEEESTEDEDYTNEGSIANASSPLLQEQTQNQNVAGSNNQYCEYSTTSTVSPAATSAAIPFQLPQTAMQQTHSTTTTTTAAFGVVHQQTSSSTTTNFVSNNLANAALSTTPAALYAQALLAQQYWATILKDAQQRQNCGPAQSPVMHNNSNGNNNNNSNNHSNINAAIYERIAYAHLLQQQIIQQQQQAAFAALLQQQKIAIQNNIAAAAAAQAANTNLFAQTANVNAFANFSSASNDNGRTPSSSTSMTTTAMNMNINSNFFAENNSNCTPTNSNISFDSLNLNVSDHDERPIASSGIISKVSQSSHD